MNSSQKKKQLSPYDKDKPFITQKIKIKIKKDGALRRSDNGQFRYYQSLVANKVRKAKLSFYDNKVCPIRKSGPKAWWKQINTLIGKKVQSQQI